MPNAITNGKPTKSTIAFPPYDISSHQNQCPQLSPLTAFLSLHYWPFASHGRRRGHVVRGAQRSCSLALPLVPKLNACVPNSHGCQLRAADRWPAGSRGMDLRGWTSIDGCWRVKQSNTKGVFGVSGMVVLIAIVRKSVVVESKVSIKRYLTNSRMMASRSMIECQVKTS